MYDETGPDGKRCYTVAQIAAEFGVTRPTIYRHLQCLTPPMKRRSKLSAPVATMSDHVRYQRCSTADR